MFILKGCPKCHGDLAAETSLRRAEADADVVCIQCGYSLRPGETRGLFRRLLPRPQVRPVPAPAYVPVRR